MGLQDMIDQTSSIWLKGAENLIVNMGSNRKRGNNAIRIIDSNEVQEDNIDEGMFVFRAGLCGQASSVSVESKLKPGSFVIHIKGRLKLHKKEDSEDFLQHSCFNVVTDRCPNGGFALQSVNNPDEVIQARDSRRQESRHWMLFNSQVSSDRFDIVVGAPSESSSLYCWANPVSQQANLAFCSSNVANKDDLYEHPECCDHEGTLEKFGECCMDTDDIGGCSKPTHRFCLLLFFHPSRFSTLSQSGSNFRVKPTLASGNMQGDLTQNYTQFLQKFPQCCKVAYLMEKIQPGAIESCKPIGERRKRSVAACNMPCWYINYCPRKMQNKNGWEAENEECCCHPFRNKVLKPKKKDYYGTCPGLD